jgi:ATP-dependent Clp protease ATP-binding subunit ClpC
MNTLETGIKEYEVAVAIEKIFSRKALAFMRAMFFVITILGGVSYFVATHITGNEPLASAMLGLTLIGFALWLEQILLFSYHNSFYFRGLNSIIGIEDATGNVATYDVARVALAYPNDITRAFCTSKFGAAVLLRADITTDVISTYLQTKRPLITTGTIPLPTEEIFSLIGLGKYLLAHDATFVAMIKKTGVTPETFIGSLRWVIGTYHQEKKLLQWWSKDNLSKIPGVGLEWSHGIAHVLKSYSRSIHTSAVFSTLTNNAPFAEKIIDDIERSLARAKSANVLLVGESGVGKIDIVMEIERRMRTGKSLDAIAGQEIIVLDTNRLFATQPTKQDFEYTLLNIFDEALKAGNIIIVIENLSVVIREAEALGVYLPELIDEYLATQLLHIIATDTPGGFHTYLEPLRGLVGRFNEILVEASDLSSTIGVLQSVALQNEVRYKTLFTYGSLKALATSADRFIVEGAMPEKAITLLIDVATTAQLSKLPIITSDFVYQCISTKTGIPAGPVHDNERETLLHLEDRLHSRVIGQVPAINSIARTMRRARTGIQSSEKPIGSFLFLGPTGVGKTETAKALAYTFFGGEAKMQRFDMSEFSAPDALERLLGDNARAGVLSNALREYPYCVLLLDEFEKAAKGVHDLFLQILDEGIFTDGRGQTVNARNTIIIATSNAGSELIRNTVTQRKVLSHLTDEIVAGIIKEKIFRPELLNRFDSTIIFEPLTLEEQGQVASMLLGGLYERVRNQGYDITLSRDLMDVVIERGYSADFGARPMQRVIQDVVEEKIARRIIDGTIKKGDTIVLNRDDFTATELVAK